MSQPNMVDRARWRLRQALGIHSPSRHFLGTCWCQDGPAADRPAPTCDTHGNLLPRRTCASKVKPGPKTDRLRAKPLDGGDAFPQEPPLSVRAVMDGEGLVMVRAGDVTDRHGVHVPAGTCDYCPAPGTWWTWLHNGNSECWLEKDFVGPMYDITHLVGEEARTA